MPFIKRGFCILGGDIIRSPFKKWFNIMHDTKVIKKFIITGPESTGKTTLTKTLCTNFKLPYQDEYARTYLNAKGKNYGYEDLLEIAKGQLNIESNISSKVKNFAIFDTDLLTIKIWSLYKFGKLDSRIETILSSYLNRTYILCYPDLPWTPDPLRENPSNRKSIFDMYQKLLISYKFKFHVIKGNDLLVRKQEVVDIISNDILK